MIKWIIAKLSDQEKIFHDKIIIIEKSTIIKKNWKNWKTFLHHNFNKIIIYGCEFFSFSPFVVHSPNVSFLVITLIIWWKRQKSFCFKKKLRKQEEKKKLKIYCVWRKIENFFGVFVTFLGRFFNLQIAYVFEEKRIVWK